jgi:IPT/TIG domain
MRSRSLIAVLTLFLVFGFLILPLGSAFGETWTKVSTNGFGNLKNNTVFASAIYNNKLYVSASDQIEGSSVWRYDGGSTWTRVSELGFGETGLTGNQVIPCLATFGSYLYAGTGNTATGCQVWRYNGSTWTKVVGNGFGSASTVYAASMAVFGGYLYCSGGLVLPGVWRTSNGTTWTQVSPTFAEFDLYVCSLAATSTNLYASVYNYSVGCHIYGTANGTAWSPVNTSGFDSSANGRYNYDGFMAADVSNLYVGTSNDVSGTEIWKYSGGTWSQINTDGFGSSANRFAYPMTYGGNLYVGVGNATAGCGVWKYVSGTTWTQMNTAGFGTNANQKARLCVFNGNLYAGTETSSASTYGCEVWSTPVAAPSLTVTGVTPASGTVGATVNITNLAGTGFVAGSTNTQVRLERAGATTINATSVAVPSSTQITCTVGLAGAQTGAYNVVVRNPNGAEAMLANGFTVNAANPCGGGAAASVALAGLLFGLLSLAGSGPLRRRLRGKIE